MSVHTFNSCETNIRQLCVSLARLKRDEKCLFSLSLERLLTLSTCCRRFQDVGDNDKVSRIHDSIREGSQIEPFLSIVWQGQCIRRVKGQIHMPVYSVYSVYSVKSQTTHQSVRKLRCIHSRQMVRFVFLLSRFFVTKPSITV